MNEEQAAAKLVDLLYYGRALFAAEGGPTRLKSLSDRELLESPNEDIVLYGVNKGVKEGRLSAADCLHYYNSEKSDDYKCDILTIMAGALHADDKIVLSFLMGVYDSAETDQLKIAAYCSLMLGTDVHLNYNIVLCNVDSVSDIDPSSVQSIREHINNM